MNKVEADNEKASQSQLSLNSFCKILLFNLVCKSLRNDVMDIRVTSSAAT